MISHTGAYSQVEWNVFCLPLEGAVEGGWGDEDGKSLHVFMDGSFQTLKMPDLQAWPDGHQDPQALVVSVGRVAAAVPDGVLLPQTVGGGVNNDFKSIAIDYKSFVWTMYEQWYALSHKTEEGGSANFAGTDRMIVAGDGEVEVEYLRRFMGTKAYRKYFKRYVETLGGIWVVNIEAQAVSLLPA